MVGEELYIDYEGEFLILRGGFCGRCWEVIGNCSWENWGYVMLEVMRKRRSLDVKGEICGWLNRVIVIII